jgi:photosystem II stability/assembly factor-like uncharacterized protein
MMKFPALLALYVVFDSVAGAAVAEWKSQPIPSTDGSVGEMAFYQERTGWICGFSAGVLRTTDGGRTWAELKSNLTTE